MRAERWQGGQLVAEEEYALEEYIDFKNELLMMLEQAGFVDITIRGDYTEENATPEHDVLVFITRKP
jgi:hypothetical protein